MLTNTVQRKSIKSNYLQFLWGRKRTWLANTISETLKNILKQFVSIDTNTMFWSKKKNYVSRI